MIALKPPSSSLRLGKRRRFGNSYRHSPWPSDRTNNLPTSLPIAFFSSHTLIFRNTSPSTCSWAHRAFPPSRCYLSVPATYIISRFMWLAGGSHLGSGLGSRRVATAELTELALNTVSDMFRHRKNYHCIALRMSAADREPTLSGSRPKSAGFILYSSCIG